MKDGTRFQALLVGWCKGRMVIRCTGEAFGRRIVLQTQELWTNASPLPIPLKTGGMQLKTKMTQFEVGIFRLKTGMIEFGIRMIQFQTGTIRFGIRMIQFGIRIIQFKTRMMRFWIGMA